MQVGRQRARGERTQVAGGEGDVVPESVVEAIEGGDGGDGDNIGEF